MAHVSLSTTADVEQALITHSSNSLRARSRCSRVVSEISGILRRAASELGERSSYMTRARALSSSLLSLSDNFFLVDVFDDEVFGVLVLPAIEVYRESGRKGEK